MLRPRIYMFLLLFLLVPNVSRQRKRPIKIEEVELLRQVEATDWMMAMNTKENYHCFVWKFVRKKPRVPNLGVADSPKQRRKCGKRRVTKMDIIRNTPLLPFPN